MLPKRVIISKKVRDSVLKEFNHKCALCGKSNPQIHHIDGDPSNREITNLIPLCPNHHLQDQHNPTEPMDSKKLALFRKFKDPAILDVRFHPLFKRLQFLDTVSELSDTEELKRNTQELLDFLVVLNMGEFYSKRVGQLLKKPIHPYITQFGDNDSEIAFEKMRKEHDAEYRAKIISNRSTAIALVIESLRFQSWENKYLDE